MPWALFVLTHLSIDAHAIINSEGEYPSGITISYLDIFVQEALIIFDGCFFALDRSFRLPNFFLGEPYGGPRYINLNNEE